MSVIEGLSLHVPAVKRLLVEAEAEEVICGSYKNLKMFKNFLKGVGGPASSREPSWASTFFWRSFLGNRMFVSFASSWDYQG